MIFKRRHVEQDQQPADEPASGTRIVHKGRAAQGWLRRAGCIAG